MLHIDLSDWLSYRFVFYIKVGVIKSENVLISL